MTEAKTTTPTLVERLVAVKDDIGAVGKEGRNTSQNFNFRGIDQVLNAVSGPLRKHGVMVFPRLQSLDKGVATTSGGKAMNTVVVTVDYVFTDGTTQISVVVPGEAFDSGDKCVAKAMSVAYRTALIQALSLPTDEPDPDHDVYDAQPQVAQISDEEVLVEMKKAVDVSALQTLWREQKVGQRSAEIQGAVTAQVAAVQGKTGA